MSLIGNSNGLSAADLAAVVGNNNDGFGGNGDGWLFILFILLLGNNGWGNGFGNNGYSEVQQGFDQAAVVNGLQNVQNAITSGTADQLATMNNLAMSLQNCCCEQRLGTANLNSTILADGCDTRQAINNGVRDLMTQSTANTQALLNSQNAGFQGIQDKLCQLELDAKNDKIADLQRQLTYAQAVADNAAQTAAIIANNEAQTTALEQYLRPVANPAYIVPNPNCCTQTYGCSSCAGM